MNTGYVLKQLKLHKPKDVADLLIYCRFTLRFLNHGAFRAVYEIVGTDLIVKVPFPSIENIAESLSCCIWHARFEFQAYKRIMRSKRKFKALHTFMPTFYYFDSRSGIAVMPRYEALSEGFLHNERMFLSRKIEELLEIPDVDIDREDNYGLDHNGKLKITDLGCFVQGLEHAFDA